jgi:hypothetical protein
MVLGRARVAGGGALAALILAVVGAGCGAESHPNEARPAVPTRVSVTIGKGGIEVQPQTIAMGPEKHQQLPQNQDHPQPPIKTKAPLDVVFVTANQTESDEKLVIKGPKHATSEPIFANSPATFSTQLPTGTYTITATEVGDKTAGLKQTSAAKLRVGPYRASSKNDLLLP